MSEEQSTQPQPQPVQPPMPTIQDLCLKAIFDNQQNLNVLIAALQQQMVYINTFLQSIEKQNDVQATIPKSTNNSNSTANQNPQISGAGSTVPTTTKQATNQPADSKHVSKENKSL